MRHFIFTLALICFYETSLAFDVDQCKSVEAIADRPVKINEICNCFSEEISKLQIEKNKKSEVSLFLDGVISGLIEAKKQYGDQKLPQEAVLIIMSNVQKKTGIQDLRIMMELMKNYGTPVLDICKQKID